MKKLSFKEIPQEPWIVQKDEITVFFYVDDIVFAFKNERTDEVKQIIESLSKALTIKVVDKLKLFLRLHVIRNRSKQTIWLSQKAYIMKICNEFAPINSSQLPSTPMKVTELFFINEDKIISNPSRILYQQKVRSL